MARGQLAFYDAFEDLWAAVEEVRSPCPPLCKVTASALAGMTSLFL